MLHVIPAGLAAAPVANSLTVMFAFKERLCNLVSVTSTNQPQALVEYTLGTPILNGTTVFVPVTARVNIVTPNSCKCEATPQVITERVMIAFEGQTALPTATSITPHGMTQGLIKVVNGCSCTYAINQSVTIAITPPAAAAAN